MLGGEVQSLVQYSADGVIPLKTSGQDLQFKPRSFEPFYFMAAMQ